MSLQIQSFPKVKESIHSWECFWTHPSLPIFRAAIHHQNLDTSYLEGSLHGMLEQKTTLEITAEASRFRGGDAEAYM